MITFTRTRNYRAFLLRSEASTPLAPTKTVLTSHPNNV